MTKGPLGAGRFPMNHSPEHQHQQAIEALRGGMRTGVVPGLRDRFGKGVSVGDLVVMKVDPDPVYLVEDMTPVVDPNVPPGHVRVRFRTQFEVILQSGQVMNAMMRVGAQPVTEQTTPTEDAAPVPVVDDPVAEPVVSVPE